MRLAKTMTALASVAVLIGLAACVREADGADEPGRTASDSTGSPAEDGTSATAEEQSFGEEFSAHFNAMRISLTWCSPPFDASQLEECDHLVGYLPTVVGELRMGLEARNDAEELTEVAEALDGLEPSMQVLTDDCDAWSAAGGYSDDAAVSVMCSTAWSEFNSGWTALETAAG